MSVHLLPTTAFNRFNQFSFRIVKNGGATCNTGLLAPSGKTRTRRKKGLAGITCSKQAIDRKGSTQRNPGLGANAVLEGGATEDRRMRRRQGGEIKTRSPVVILTCQTGVCGSRPTMRRLEAPSQCEPNISSNAVTPLHPPTNCAPRG